MYIKYNKVYKNGTQSVPATMRNAQQRHIAYVQGNLQKRTDERGGEWVAEDIRILS